MPLLLLLLSFLSAATATVTAAAAALLLADYDCYCVLCARRKEDGWGEVDESREKELDRILDAYLANKNEQALLHAIKNLPNLHDSLPAKL